MQCCYASSAGGARHNHHCCSAVGHGKRQGRMAATPRKVGCAAQLMECSAAAGAERGVAGVQAPSLMASLMASLMCSRVRTTVRGCAASGVILCAAPMLMTQRWCVCWHVSGRGRMTCWAPELPELHLWGVRRMLFRTPEQCHVQVVYVYVLQSRGMSQLLEFKLHGSRQAVVVADRLPSRQLSRCADVGCTFWGCAPVFVFRP